MDVDQLAQPTSRYDWALVDEMTDRNDWGCAINECDPLGPEIVKWMALGKSLWNLCDGGRSIIDLTVLVDSGDWDWVDVERGGRFLELHGLIRDHTSGVSMVRDIEIVWLHRPDLVESEQPHASLFDKNRLWITVEEAAELFDVCPRTAYESVRDGSLPSFRIGRQYRIPMSGIRSLLMLDDG